MPRQQRQIIQQHLESAQASAKRRAGRSPEDSDRRAIEVAMADLDALRLAYREALVGQAQSVRVKQIADDFLALEALLASFGNQFLTPEQEDRVRNRIKTWHYESRRWIQDLPHQPCIRQLPPLVGLSQADPQTKVDQLWLQAGGGWFAPVPLARRFPRTAASPRFDPRAQLHAAEAEPMESGTSPEHEDALSRWKCRAEPLQELLAVAREALQVEVGGPNLGGHASFEQRRHRASLKDAFAFTCLRIYEKAVGPKTARQGDALRRDLNEASFDHFVALVHRWVAGPGAPVSWEPGVGPIRKAIATQRAWQKLLKIAKCKDEDAFNALPLEDQKAAARKLPEKGRLRLTPPAPPLI